MNRGPAFNYPVLEAPVTGLSILFDEQSVEASWDSIGDLSYVATLTAAADATVTTEVVEVAAVAFTGLTPGLYVFQVAPVLADGATGWPSAPYSVYVGAE